MTTSPTVSGPQLPVVRRAHARLVMARRVRVLARHIGELVPSSGSLLDVGCGDGAIAALLREDHPGVQVQGLDVLARPRCAIPMQIYDGRVFPVPDRSVDAVLFTDVLHHTPDPLALLREAWRVTRHCIVIKDHRCDSRWAEQVLRVMDWVGNRPHGVVLPYNYWSARQWQEAWSGLGLVPDVYRTDLGLYPTAFQPVFERGLHFIARLLPRTAMEA